MACARLSCPSRFATLTGNGCHMHVSLWKGDAQCVRRPERRTRPVADGYHFIGGVMHSAEACARITNPTVNSYKRINAPRDAVRRDLVAQHGDLDRQQPHPHDPHSGGRPLRVAARRRGGQSLSAAGGCPGRRARRRGATNAIRASGSTSTCTPRATRSKAPRAAAQSARRVARAREVGRAQGGVRRSESSLPTSSSNSRNGTTIPATHHWERQTTLDC